MDNPFVEAYNAIFNALVSNQQLTDLVSISNRIRHVKGEDPNVESKQPGDVPRIELIPTQGLWLIPSSSDSATITQTYEVRLVSGELDAETYLELKWQVGRAIGKAYLEDLFDTDLIPVVRVGDFVDNIDDFTEQEGLQGWTGTIQIEVEIWLDDSCITGG